MGSTLHLTGVSGGELPHTCWVRPGVYLLPTSRHCGIYFPTWPPSTAQPRPLHGLCLPEAQCLGTLGAGFPSGARTPGGPPHLGSCCPSRTGPRSPASPAGEQNRKSARTALGSPVPAPARSRASSPSSHHITHKCLVLLCSTGWTTRLILRVWRRASPRGATSGINYGGGEKVPEAFHVGSPPDPPRDPRGSDPITTLAHTCLHSLRRVPAKNIFCGSFSAFEKVHDS